ncbi:MAG: sugar ABC transporter substrate-binding protein [Treponema sp.]|nr:sugar ABC transporter substrate-binding protein [Treponema sp.]
MKKIAIIGVILLLVSSFVFATGNRESAPSSQSQQQQQGRTVITFSFWGTPEEWAVTQATADKFNNSQNRIEVMVRQIAWEVYDATLNTMAAANRLPDCGMMQEASALQFASNGLLADMSQMYPAGQARPLDSLAFKGPDGKVVAYSTANEILLLYYNRAMFDKAGIPYPPANVANAWTWDQFVDVAKKLTLDANGRTPNDAGFDANRIVQYGAMVDNLTWQLEVWALSNGGGFYSPDGKSVIIDQPAAMDAIQRVADLHLVHKVAPLSPGNTDDGIQRSILTGTVAMATGGQWNVGTAFPEWKAAGNNYGVAVLPHMGTKVTINTGGPVVVFSQSRNQAAAMEWLRWYTQEENSWGLIESGIWMPILDKYYTNEADTRRWVNNPNFPPYAEYKSAVVDYARTNSRSAAWYYTPNTNDFNQVLGAALGDVWTGRRTARDAITGAAAALRRANSGR